MDSIVLFETMVLDPELPGLRCLRVSSAPYDHPSAPGAYEERLLEASWLERNLFRHALPFGRLGGARGWMILGNLDGRLDWLAAALVDGRPARLLAGAAGTVYDSFVPLFTGVVEQVLVGRDEVTLVLCDRLALLDDAPLDAEVGTVGEVWRSTAGAAGPLADDHCVWPVRLEAAGPVLRLQALADAAAAWIGSDTAGRSRLLLLLPPETASPTAVLHTALEPLYTSRKEFGPPVHQVTVRGPGGTGLWTDPTLARRFPLATRLTLETGLCRAEHADALASRLGALFGRPRRRWRASLALAPAEAAALDLGAVVAVGEARLLVTGLAVAPVSRRLEATLWG